MDNQFISLEMLGDYISYLHEQECRQSTIAKYKKIFRISISFLVLARKLKKRRMPVEAEPD